MAYTIGTKNTHFHAIHDPLAQRWLVGSGWDDGEGWRLRQVRWSQELVSLGRNRTSCERVLDQLADHWQQELERMARDLADLEHKARLGRQVGWNINRLRQEILQRGDDLDSITRLVIMRIDVETRVGATPA